jgi:hypothetical protein
MMRFFTCFFLLVGCGDLPLIQDYVDLTLHMEDPRDTYLGSHPGRAFQQSFLPPQRRSLENPILSAGIMVYFVNLRQLGSGSPAWSPSLGIHKIQSLASVGFKHEHDTINRTVRLPVGHYDVYAIGYSGVPSIRGPEIVSEPIDHRCFRLHNINVQNLSQLSVMLEMNQNVTETEINQLSPENTSLAGCQFSSPTSLRSPFSNQFKEQTTNVTLDTESAWTPTEFGVCAPGEPAFFAKQMGNFSGSTYLREVLQHQDLFASEWTDSTLVTLRDGLDTRCKLGVGKSLSVRLAQVAFDKAKGEEAVTFMRGVQPGKCLDFQQTGYSDHIPLPIGSYNQDGQHLSVPLVMDLFDAPGCPTTMTPSARYFLKNGLIHSEREAYAWTGDSLTTLLQSGSNGEMAPNHVGRMFPDQSATKRLMIFLRQAGMEQALPVSGNHRVYLRKLL